MLVNLQKLAWRDGQSLSVVQRATFRTTRFYLQNATSSAVWQRLLRGEVNVQGITRVLVQRVWRRALAACDPAVSLLRRQETQVGRVRRNIHNLRRRQVPILYVLSGNDPGLDEIADYFGSNGRKLRRQHHVTFRILEGADHTLSAHWARQALLAEIAGFLWQRCGVTVPLARPVEPPDEKPVTDAPFAPAIAIDSLAALHSAIV